MPPSRLMASPSLARIATDPTTCVQSMSARLISRSSIGGARSVGLNGQSETGATCERSLLSAAREIRMTRPHSLTGQRAIYDRDLQVRLDAALARARRFLDSTSPRRASVWPRDTPFTPFCLSCQESGRAHAFPPDYPQHYICAHCHRRWVGQPCEACGQLRSEV